MQTAIDRDLADRAAGCFLGLAIGDAIGTTIEFRTRDTYEHLNGIVGGGPFRLRPGEWTDDTSMALALADSLIECGAVDPTDLMNRFVRWYREGEYSPAGRCFDIGNATRSALDAFCRTGDPLAGSVDEHSAGNGSLMRLAPAAIWGASRSEGEAAAAARLQSACTHGATACLDACEAYALILRAAIRGADFEDALVSGRRGHATEVGPVIAGSWRQKERHQIESSGYVIHSLEAALWCVERTGTFSEAVLLAANLGDDADTTAAITGQLAGAIYGKSGVPDEWLDMLAWSERIERAALRLVAT